MNTSTITIHHIAVADRRLADLAALDSRALPAGPFLVGEVDGEARAALSLGEGVAFADPFHPTAELVDLLRAHASARAAEAPRRRAGLRRRLAIA